MRPKVGAGGLMPSLMAKLLRTLPGKAVVGGRWSVVSEEQAISSVRAFAFNWPLTTDH
jgi:hypothetical protein